MLVLISLRLQGMFSNAFDLCRDDVTGDDHHEAGVSKERCAKLLYTFSFSFSS